MSEEGDRRRVEVWLEPKDWEIIEHLMKRYGATAANAMRIGLRKFAETLPEFTGDSW